MYLPKSFWDEVSLVARNNFCDWGKHRPKAEINVDMAIKQVLGGIAEQANDREAKKQIVDEMMEITA